MSFSNQAPPPDGYAHSHPGADVKRSNGLAITALVLGIAAILLFWTVFGGILLGLLAVVFGILGARKARGGRAPHGKMSVIGAVLGALGLIASGVILAIGASILNSDEFENFDDCMKDAKSQSDRDACAKDFDRDINN